LIFTDFSYQGTGADASSVTVRPLTAPDDEGFQFAGGWSAHSVNGVSESEASHINYTVERPGGMIDSLSQSFSSSVTGTGVSSVAEIFCMASRPGLCPAQGSINLTNPGSGFTSRVFFAGVSSVSVSKSINVTSGVNGIASIANVSDTFSAPEPLSFLLLGSGLLGIGLMRRRLNRR
jgi:hypothetical protein